MNKLHWILLLPILLFIACDDDDDGNGPPPGPGSLVWTASPLWDSGSKPVASPDGTRILFLEEGEQGGLYVLENEAARKLNEGGPAVRSDYAWSADGTRICFSGPGLPGEASAGIYVSINADLTEFERIWDRGSQPVFADDDQNLFCAGPEGSENEGIWKIDLANPEPAQIIPQGVAPKLSPTGNQLAYLFTTGSSLGRSLVVFDRQYLTYDTLGVGAASFTWSDDSQYLIYESIRDDEGLSQPSKLMKVSVDDGVLPGELLFEGGRDPMALPESELIVYAALSGDQAIGIWLTDLAGNRTQLTDSGATPFAAAADRIVASGPVGLFELTGE